MLNSTIFGLSTILLAGSPFSMAPATGSRTFSVDKSLFTKSLHNLFYFNIFKGNAKFSRTTFDNIIGGAIRVDSSYDVKDQVINTRYHPNIMSSNYYTFESCMFRDIKTAGETNNGGAVSFFVPITADYDVDSSFEFSSFYNCFAAGGQGGAIFGQRVGDVSLYETCFMKCTTRESSSTGDMGSGTAVYIWHREKTERTKSRGSSYTECPATTKMNPNTENTFLVLNGKVDFDNSNFSNNFLEAGASALCFMEQDLTEVDFTTCYNCSSECTFHITGQDSQKSHIKNCNFVKCDVHSEAKEVKGIIAVLHTQIMLSKCVFILGEEKYLAFRDNSTDTASKISFEECKFDLKKEEMSDLSFCSFTKCEFAQDEIETNKYTYFDSRECWEIDPKHYGASNDVYAFFIFFGLFAAIVAFGIYLQVTQVLCGEAVVSTKYDSAPAISEPINKAQYDTLPE